MMRLPRAAAFAAVFAVALAWQGAALSAQASPDPNIKKSDYSLPDIPKEKPGALPSPGFQSTAPIRFSLRYRIISQAEPDSKWVVLPDQTTLPGQRVPLKLTHPTLVVLSELIPIPVSPTAVRLRAFNQIWIAQGKSELSYMTSQSAATVPYDEEVFFYPLGSQSYTTGILQMSITMHIAAEEKK